MRRLFTFVTVRSTIALILTFVSLCFLWLRLSETRDNLNPVDSAADEALDAAIQMLEETGQVAKKISASDLLSRPPVAQSNSIPRIIHQSWKSSTLPFRFKSWSLSCRRKHKDWEWVLWTDEDNLNLVRHYFPWLEEAYHNLPCPIFRADFVRSLYMYKYGGVYADLDTECLQPTEELERSYGPLFNDAPVNTALFGRMGNDTSFEHSIPNAWMAAAPGHPFFLVMMKEMTERLETMRGKKKTDIPELITGPIALRAAISMYKRDKALQSGLIKDAVAAAGKDVPVQPSEMHKVLLLPSRLIYPYSWSVEGENVRGVCWVTKNSFHAGTCKKRLGVDDNGSIAITYWSHTHG